MTDRGDRAMAQAKKVAADPIKQAELMLAEGVGMSESCCEIESESYLCCTAVRVKTRLALVLQPPPAWTWLPTNRPELI